jgi:hypothetical protein
MWNPPFSAGHLKNAFQVEPGKFESRSLLAIKMLLFRDLNLPKKLEQNVIFSGSAIPIKNTKNIVFSWFALAIKNPEQNVIFSRFALEWKNPKK